MPIPIRTTSHTPVSPRPVHTSGHLCDVHNQDPKRRYCLVTKSNQRYRQTFRQMRYREERWDFEEGLDEDGYKIPKNAHAGVVMGDEQQGNTVEYMEFVLMSISHEDHARIQYEGEPGKKGLRGADELAERMIVNTAGTHDPFRGIHDGVFNPRSVASHDKLEMVEGVL